MKCDHCIEGTSPDTVTCENDHFQDIKVKKAKYFTPIDFECVDFLD